MGGSLTAGLLRQTPRRAASFQLLDADAPELEHAVLGLQPDGPLLGHLHGLADLLAVAPADGLGPPRPDLALVPAADPEPRELAENARQPALGDGVELKLGAADVDAAVVLRLFAGVAEFQFELEVVVELFRRVQGH